MQLTKPLYGGVLLKPLTKGNQNLNSPEVPRHGLFAHEYYYKTIGKEQYHAALLRLFNRINHFIERK